MLRSTGVNRSVVAASTLLDLVPRGLTVLAAIRQGEEQRLREILLPIGDDIRGRTRTAIAGPPRIDFTSSRQIHFARFAVIDDPDRGPGRKRLLYSSNYDGELDDHLAELAALTSDMDAIWGCCERYEGAARFGEFIRAHAHDPEAFYIAFRDESAEHIRQLIALRRRVQHLATPAAGAGTRIGASLINAMSRLIRALPIVFDLPRAIARSGFMNVYRGTLKLIASLDRYPVFRFANWLTRNRLPPMRSSYSSVGLDNRALPGPIAPGDATALDQDRLPPTYREDVVSQNQLTLVTDIRPGQVDRVRAVMAAIDSYARRLAPPGSLIGISTIHFVRWVVIDDGRRLMLLSDYDGSWESYIDEFAELILSGLDAIWETAEGYPPDGARDLPAFKRLLRTHQQPSEIFYSAYPDETILNILHDRMLADAWSQASDQSAGQPQEG